MKKIFTVTLALLSFSSLAQSSIGKIVSCPNSLKLIPTSICRQASSDLISVWDKADKLLLASKDGNASAIAFPFEKVSQSLALQYTSTIDDVFYNALTKEWVIYNYSTTYGRKSVVIINENKMGSRELVLELFSETNNIHLNTVFEDDKILVTSDDGSKTIQLRRDTRNLNELISEGMELHLRNENLPNTNIYEVVSELVKECKDDEKCLQKEKKAITKRLSKQYKDQGNKLAANYLKDYTPLGYPLNRYKDFLEGCVASPLSCQGIIANTDAYYRLNIDLDNGNRNLSYNVFMPSGFSVLYSYIPLLPIVN